MCIYIYNIVHTVALYVLLINSVTLPKYKMKLLAVVWFL